MNGLKIYTPLIFFLICNVFFYDFFSESLIASENLYRKAEGFYAQKKLDQALIYYLASVKDMRKHKNSSELKSALKRIIQTCSKNDMTDIMNIYVREYQKYWPEDILDIYKLPGAFISASVKDQGTPDALGNVVKKIIPDPIDFKTSDLAVKCTVYKQDDQPWEYKRILRPAEQDAFYKDPNGFEAFLKREASVNYAESRGYLTESFGSENYKMLSISLVTVEIIDVINRKVLFKSLENKKDLNSRGEME